MTIKRGEVVLAYYPFASGASGSRRPVLVVQNDADNARLANTIVAQITSNLGRAAELGLGHPVLATTRIKTVAYLERLRASFGDRWRDDWE